MSMMKEKKILKRLGLVVGCNASNNLFNVFARCFLTLYLIETLFSSMLCHRALKEDTNDGKTKGVASELQDEGEEDEDEEDEEDADGDGDPAARGSNEEAGAAAINEKLFLGISTSLVGGGEVVISCEVPQRTNAATVFKTWYFPPWK